MVVFTWNVHRSESALRVALAHLEQAARTNDVLACFQEVPPQRSKRSTWVLPGLLDSGSLTARGLRVAGVLCDGRVVLIVSAGLTPKGAARPDKNERMLYVELQTGAGNAFGALGFHALDQRNFASEFVRGSHAALARRELDELWGGATPLVFLGDFNADPSEQEIYAREGLFSVSQMESVTPATRTHYGRTSPPLRNLMPAGLGTLSGTYYDQRRKWLNLDQIAVSEHLADAVQGVPRTLNRLLHETLVTPSGRPKGSEYSDHLPVEATIQI